MGKFQVGILGGFDGKVGTVVGGRWKGIDYMRHKGRKSTKPPTAAQLDQQAKFALVSRFIHKLGKLLMKSFKDTPELTGINVAFSYTYEKAIKGIYPLYQLEHSKILVSKGELQNAVSPMAVANGNGEVKFTWNDNSGDTLANEDDKAVMVVYCPETNQAVYNKAGAARNTKTDTIHVGNFTGKIVQTWISFTSKDEKEFATSIYTGEITVS